MSFLEEYGVEKIEEVQEEIKKEKFNMFDVMTSCLNKKRVPSDEELSKISPYIFHNLLSGDVNTLMISVFLDRYEYIIPVENQWKFVNKIVPKYFIKYPKQEKEPEEISKLQEIYCINKETAKEYYKILPKKELKKIIAKHSIKEGKL
jgi:hypothetical protein